MEEDLSAIAKEYVLQGFQENEDMLSRVSALEVPLNDVYGIHCPIARDYDDRRDLIRVFNEIAREIYGNRDECPVVEEFGSFLMDMFNAKSDLDLSINFSDKKAESQRDVKIKTLRSFTKKLRSLQKKGHIRNIHPIYSATVPVLKVTDHGTGVECDLSVGNLDGIAKSYIILIVSAIDERFRKLCFLMKAWAKAHDINSPKDGTLNSLSLILLVAFHLQTRNPPIFPPFSALFKDGTDPVAVEKIVPSFMNYGKENKESLAELFVSLLFVLESVETLWPKGLCASVYKGSWIFKTWKTKKGENIGDISIEDFADRTQNTARAVRSSEMNKIYSCIRHSLHKIRCFINGMFDAAKLKDRMFGPDPRSAVESTTNFDTRYLHNRFLKNPTQKKRKKGNSTKTRKELVKPNESSHPSWIEDHTQRKGKNRTKGNSTKSRKESEKSNESSCPPLTSSREGAIRVDRSQETTGGTRSSSFSHSSLSSQVSTEPHHHAPCFPQSPKELEKSNESACPPLTSSREGAIRVDRSQETIGGTRSNSFSHSSLSSQVSIKPHHRTPYFPQSHKELGKSNESSRPPLTSSREGAIRVDRSKETTGGARSNSFSHSSLSSQVSIEPHHHAPYFPQSHKESEKSNESSRPPLTSSREGAIRVDRSQETTGGTRSNSFSHSSLSSQVSTEPHHHAPYFAQSRKELEKSNESACPPLTSSREGAIRVDRSPETTGGTRSNSLSHSSLSGQASTGPYHHSPRFPQSRKKLEKSNKSSRPPLTSREAIRVDRSQETAIGTRSNIFSHSSLPSQVSIVPHHHTPCFPQSRKELEKSNQSSRPPSTSSREVTIRVDRSQETAGGTRSNSFYHSSLSGQASTGPHHHSPRFPQSRKKLEKSNKSSRPPLTSSREGAIRVDRSQETASGTRSNSFAHPNLSSQVSTESHHHAPYFPHCYANSTQKPNQGSCPPLTSFQEQTIGGNRNHSFSHSNLSGQVSTGVYPQSLSFSHSSSSSQASTRVNHNHAPYVPRCYAPHRPHPNHLPQPHRASHFHHPQQPPQHPRPYHPPYPPQPSHVDDLWPRVYQ